MTEKERIGLSFATCLGYQASDAATLLAEKGDAADFKGELTRAISLSSLLGKSILTDDNGAGCLSSGKERKGLG